MEDFARYEKGARTHLGKTVVRVSNANQKHLDETKDRLGDTEKELSITKSQLSEQNLLRKAHQETEDRLNAICNELKGTLESTTADLRGYQEKLGISLFVFTSDFSRTQGSGRRGKQDAMEKCPARFNNACLEPRQSITNHVQLPIIQVQRDGKDDCLLPRRRSQASR
jgi:hypothetical protein